MSTQTEQQKPGNGRYTWAELADQFLDDVWAWGGNEESRYSHLMGAKSPRSLYMRVSNMVITEYRLPMEYGIYTELRDTINDAGLARFKFQWALRLIDWGKVWELFHDEKWAGRQFETEYRAGKIR